MRLRLSQHGVQVLEDSLMVLFGRTNRQFVTVETDPVWATFLVPIFGSNGRLDRVRKLWQSLNFPRGDGMGTRLESVGVSIWLRCTRSKHEDQ